jgi:protein-S-isoprenylcysteine O-methyltransferase Ste14
MTRQRIDWYLRVVPAALLACFYFLIVLLKLNSVVAPDDVAEGSGWMVTALGSIHAVSIAIFYLILGLMMFVRKAPIRRERRLIGWLMPLAVMTAFVPIGIAPLQDMSALPMLIATILVVGGTAFTIYALRHLGRHFGVVSDVRGLVTTGSYRWVRHPLYAGELITLAGLVIAVATPFTVASFAVVVSLQTWRAKIEEQSLTAAFPEYKEYAARTPMLIPFAKLPARTLSGSPVVEHQH